MYIYIYIIQLIPQSKNRNHNTAVYLRHKPTYPLKIYITTCFEILMTCENIYRMQMFKGKPLVSIQKSNFDSK